MPVVCLWSVRVVSGVCVCARALPHMAALQTSVTRVVCVVRARLARQRTNVVARTSTPPGLLAAAGQHTFGGAVVDESCTTLNVL